MRTDQEVLERIEYQKTIDLFGFSIGKLADTLPYEMVKVMLKAGTTREDWGDPNSRDHETIKAQMLDYMPFAWDKANNNRGLSAGRSILHMTAWLWLLGLDDAAKQIEDYDLYGKPQLRAICEHFGWDWRQWDDGRWTESEMSDGQSAPETVFKLAA